MTTGQAMSTGEADRAGTRGLWDLNQMGQELQPCSAAITLGSHDLGVATATADLYHSGLFPVAAITGGTGAAAQHQ